jgi:ribulose-phosphate 3-epimerase
MSIICPTITAKESHQYRSQIELVSKFASRIHIDVADGIFASKLIDPKRIWLPELISDIHLMYVRPQEILKKLVSLQPNMIIVHYEADCNLIEIADILKSHDIKFGVAILQQTDVSRLKDIAQFLDHVLIFSGHLGFFGGNLEINLIGKAKQIKDLDADIEIGWDGGINSSNIKLLSESGIDVMNVGGYIHKSISPALAYESLVSALETSQ